MTPARGWTAIVRLTPRFLLIEALGGTWTIRPGIVFDTVRKKWGISPHDETVEAFVKRVLLDQLTYYDDPITTLSVFYFLYPEANRIPPETLDSMRNHKFTG